MLYEPKPILHYAQLLGSGISATIYLHGGRYIPEVANIARTVVITNNDECNIKSELTALRWCLPNIDKVMTKH